MLADVIEPKAVLFQVNSQEKEEVLREMVEKLCESGVIAKPDEIYDAVLERERERSTGLERGLAVPHCRTSAVSRIHVAMTILREGIEWGSLDGRPAHFIFLVVGPIERPEEYLKLLSQISRLMKSEAVRKSLLEAKTPQEVIDSFKLD